MNIAFQELELDNNVYYYTLKESNEIDDEEKQQQEDEQEGPDGKLELIIDNINRDIFEKASSYRLFQSRIYYGYLPEHEFITSIQNQNKFSYNEKDSTKPYFHNYILEENNHGKILGMIDSLDINSLDIKDATLKLANYDIFKSVEYKEIDKNNIKDILKSISNVFDLSLHKKELDDLIGSSSLNIPEDSDKINFIRDIIKNEDTFMDLMTNTDFRKNYIYLKIHFQIKIKL